MRSLLFSTDRDGTVLAVFPTATVDKYGFRENAPGAMTFSVPTIEQPEVTTEFVWPSTWPATWGSWTVTSGQPLREVLDPNQGHEVGILRAGRVAWQGPLVTVNEQADRIEFGAEGLLAYLRDMYVTQTLETTSYPSGDHSGPISGATVISRDQHLIVKALIDHHQNKGGGDFRLDTTGITASGTLRDRQYKGWEKPNIYEQVRNLTEVIGGPDIEVDPATREVNLFTPRRGRRRSATVFNDRNVRQFGRTLDRNWLASQILAVGAGEERETLQITRTSSVAVSRVGLVQKVTSHKSVSVRSTLQDHADAELDERDDIPNILSPVVATDDPPLFSYEMGDQIRLHYRSKYEPVDEFVRLVGMDVHPQSGGTEERATLHCLPVGT